jgi:hypothetical protein
MAASRPNRAWQKGANRIERAGAMTTNQHPLTLRKRDKWRLEGSMVSLPEALSQIDVLALEDRLRKTRTESTPEIQDFSLQNQSRRQDR